MRPSASWPTAVRGRRGARSRGEKLSPARKTGLPLRTMSGPPPIASVTSLQVGVRMKRRKRLVPAGTSAGERGDDRRDRAGDRRGRRAPGAGEEADAVLAWDRVQADRAAAARAPPDAVVADRLDAQRAVGGDADARPRRLRRMVEHAGAQDDPARLAARGEEVAVDAGDGAGRRRAPLERGQRLAAGDRAVREHGRKAVEPAGPRG